MAQPAGFLLPTLTAPVALAIPPPDPGGVIRVAAGGLVRTVRQDSLSTERLLGPSARACDPATPGAPRRRRIYLEATVGGGPGGSVLTVGDPAQPCHLSALIAAPGAIRHREVIRNGAVIHRQEVGDWRAPLSLADHEPLAACWLESPHCGQFVYYYFLVTCASGAQAWSSPIWLLADPARVL